MHHYTSFKKGKHLAMRNISGKNMELWEKNGEWEKEGLVSASGGLPVPFFTWAAPHFEYRNVISDC